MKRCTNCQTENPDGQKFCSKCGGSLESELAKFLTAHGLSEHLALFEKNDLFTIAEVKALSEGDISDLQSQSGSKIPFGDLIRLRKGLASLSEGGVPSQESPPVVVEKSKLERLKDGASQGDLNDMFSLGEIYSDGSEEVGQDLGEGASWYRKAADKGHAGAQYQYAEALYYGHGISEDERESAKWLRLAARQGHEVAKNNYNDRLEEGRFAYLLDSAEQGNGESQYRLGSLFYHGEQGYPVDKGQSAAWFRKATAQGIAAAQYTLGVMTLNGDGVRQDEPEGRRLIQASAAQGYREAIDLLAQITPSEIPSQYTASALETQSQPAPNQELINKVGNGYLMMLLYPVTCGTTSLVGIVMAYMNRGKVPEGYLKSHCRWQIRSFWFFCLWTTVGSMAAAIIEPGKINEGAWISLLAFFWYYYRAFKGKGALKRGEVPSGILYGQQEAKVFKPVLALMIVVLIGAGALKAYKQEQKNKVQLSATERARKQADEDREARQRQLQAQQQSENESRLTREKAEAEEKARQAQQAAEQAEKEKQEAIQRAQQAEQNAQEASRASARPASDSGSHGYLGINGNDGQGHLVNGVQTLINGAFVTGVEQGSPAGRAGIRVNDLITSVGGVPVQGFEQLQQQILKYRAGDAVAIGVVHNGGESETFSVRLGSAEAISAQPVKQASGQQQLPDGFSDFFKQYVRDHGSNNPWDLAYDYADPCYFCYANGTASRAYIYDDIRKLVQAYPQRSYSDVSIDNISIISPDTVRVRYHFKYQYSGKKLASGTSTVDLEVRSFSGKWQITSFSEQVIRH